MYLSLLFNFYFCSNTMSTIHTNHFFLTAIFYLLNKWTHFISFLSLFFIIYLIKINLSENRNYAALWSFDMFQWNIAYKKIVFVIHFNFSWHSSHSLNDSKKNIYCKLLFKKITKNEMLKINYKHNFFV